LSYTVANLYKNSGIVTFSATLQNPLLVFDYTGIEPEIGSKDNPGIDNNIYPRVRTFLFGVNASF
ncbi:MAG: hypothetical protein AAGD05_17310, partial [Bacteroidota bacterium]